MWQTIHILFYKDSPGSLILYSLQIKSNYVLYLTIYNIPFLLSTCFSKNEKQAGAELGKAGNKLNRDSHIRCWSYLVSSVVRIWINKFILIYCSGLLSFTHLLFFVFNYYLMLNIVFWSL